MMYIYFISEFQYSPLYSHIVFPNFILMVLDSSSGLRMNTELEPILILKWNWTSKYFTPTTRYYIDKNEGQGFNINKWDKSDLRLIFIKCAIKTIWLRNEWDHIFLIKRF